MKGDSELKVSQEDPEETEWNGEGGEVSTENR